MSKWTISPIPLVSFIHRMIERFRMSVSTGDAGSEKVNNLISKVLAFTIAIIIAVVGVMWRDTTTRISSLEDRVSYLTADKVSRAEFREEVAQLRIQNEAMKSDIISRQEVMKSDILARIDLLIPHIVNRSISK